MTHIEDLLEMQLGGPEGLLGDELKGDQAVLVLRVGVGSILEERLRGLGLFQQTCEVQGGVSSRSLRVTEISRTVSRSQ